MFRRLILLAALLPATALAVTPASPTSTAAPSLAVTRGDAVSGLHLSEIEQVGTHSVELHHPEGLDGTFTGVWLDDLLAYLNLHEADRIRLVAADHYTVFLTPVERAERRYLLVTRFEGEPIPLERQGPFMLVVPDDAEAVRAGTLPMTKWIWSVVEIRAR